jgi:hypothetical protein
VKTIALRHYRAPGDVLMLTALARDLKTTYPDRYRIIANSPYPYLWEGNNYIESHASDGQIPKGVEVISLSYGPYMPRAKSIERRHFVGAFHSAFKARTELVVPLLLPHGHLALTPQETTPLISGRYWIIMSGGKSDFKTKHWRYEWHQEVANALRASGIQVVTAGALVAPGKGRPASSHPRLANTIDMIGKTNLRAFIRLIAGADGVIGPVTFAMHAAAALGKPYVAIAGGVEEWWWEAYVRQNPGFGDVGHKLPVEHRFLHTMNLLDCCQNRGCWAMGVSPSDTQRVKCKKPIQLPDQTLPKCMSMITPERVIASVLSYYLDGTLKLEPGMSLPAVDQPVTIKDSNGRTYAVSLNVIEPGDKALPVIRTDLEPVKEPEIKPTVLPGRKPQTNAAARSRDESLARVGGKLTGFVLFYGDFADMHARCLNAILNTTEPHEYELRVFLNATCRQTSQLVKRRHEEGKIAAVYESTENCFKYPAMRKMFHDPNKPIETDWVMWFDDDTMADVDTEWLPKLCNVIADGVSVDPMLAMVGPKFNFKVNQKQAEWFREAEWFKGKPFRDTVGRGVPNGDRIHFITGSCWALKSALIRDACIPDTRLQHQGGDVTLGEQVYQLGGTLKNWNGDKKTVLWSSVKRRGVTQPMFNLG